MGSPANPSLRKDAVRYSGGAFELWNRRLHFHTGLLLNHPKWKFAEFWPTRRQTTFERQISPPPAGTDLAQARNILAQLGLSGEIEWTSARGGSRQLDFQLSRPGHMFEVKTDFDRGRTVVQRIDVNAWGVLHVLHTFTGVRAADPLNRRDWVLTSVWALSMDAGAAGLLIMVFGSYYMWWRLPQKREWGWIALLSGWLACAVFVFGLRLFI